ncbi:hypothetical protein Dimus_033977, partial [Dionaea muscipula]
MALPAGFTGRAPRCCLRKPLVAPLAAVRRASWSCGLTTRVFQLAARPAARETWCPFPPAVCASFTVVWSGHCPQLVLLGWWLAATHAAF